MNMIIFATPKILVFVFALIAPVILEGKTTAVARHFPAGDSHPPIIVGLLDSVFLRGPVHSFSNEPTPRQSAVWRSTADMRSPGSSTGQDRPVAWFRHPGGSCALPSVSNRFKYVLSESSFGLHADQHLYALSGSSLDGRNKLGPLRVEDGFADLACFSALKGRGGHHHDASTM
ncbi:hypothetical protein VTN00DRAFT_1595 [Thermoascus crustaceus]|uniref:uncharacterized protein n=1 Tax=Thermoascus crustaceus TaxID=5088 RepID=UPI003742E502